MPRVLNLGNVLDLINDGFDNRPFARYVLTMDREVLVKIYATTVTIGDNIMRGFNLASSSAEHKLPALSRGRQL